MYHVFINTLYKYKIMYLLILLLFYCYYVFMKTGPIILNLKQSFRSTPLVVPHLMSKPQLNKDLTSARLNSNLFQDDF